METHKRFHIERNALRIYLIGTGILMTIYCGLLCFGIRHMAAEIACITFGYILLCGGAWMFKLCWISWAMIAYTYAIRICIVLYAEGFFSGDIYGLPIEHIAHIVAFVAGIFLTSCFFIRFRHYINVIRDIEPQ